MQDRGDPVSTDQSPPPRWRTPRSSLFVKSFVTLLIAVVTPLLRGAASEAWFGYRGQRAALNELLQAESRSATERIQTFIDGIRDRGGDDLVHLGASHGAADEQFFRERVHDMLLRSQ